MTTATITLIGGPTALIELNGFCLLTDPTFDAPGEYELSYVTLKKTGNPALRAYTLSMESKAGSKFLFCLASLSEIRFALFRTHSSPDQIGPDSAWCASNFRAVEF